jgi:hypothetical protein
MKNTLKLTQLGLIDIPYSAACQINGGWILVPIQLLGVLLITEWESTKRAAVDAWNGTYNPPA